MPPQPERPRRKLSPGYSKNQPPSLVWTKGCYDLQVKMSAPEILYVGLHRGVCLSHLLLLIVMLQGFFLSSGDVSHTPPYLQCTPMAIPQMSCHVKEWTPYIRSKTSRITMQSVAAEAPAGTSGHNWRPFYMVVERPLITDETSESAAPAGNEGITILDSRFLVWLKVHLMAPWLLPLPDHQERNFSASLQ